MNATLMGVLLSLNASFMWGILPVVLEFAHPILSPITIIWSRFFIAFIGLSLFYLFKCIKYKKNLHYAKAHIPAAGLAVLCLHFNYYAYIKGLTLTSPNSSQILGQLGPLMLAIIGVWWFKEKIVKIQLLGCAVATMGFVLFYWDQLESFIQNKEIFNSGVQWILAASTSWALFAGIQKHLVDRGMDGQSINLLVYGSALFIFLPWCHFSELTSLNFMQMLMVLFLGLNTLFAYGSLALAFKYIASNKVSILITTSPVLTVVVMGVMNHLGIAEVRKEITHSLGYFGACFVILGAILVASGKTPKSTFIKESFHDCSKSTV